MARSNPGAKSKKADGKPPSRDLMAGMRAKQALQLAIRGVPYDEIAEQAGYSNRGAAWNAVQRELHNTIKESADELRLMMTAQLRALLTKQMEKALSDSKDADWACDRVVRLHERLAKLHALDLQPNNTALAAAQVIVREYPVGIAEAV